MEFPDGIQEGDKPIPWGLKAIYLLIALWCLWYLGVSLKRHGIGAVAPVEQQVAVP